MEHDEGDDTRGLRILLAWVTGLVVLGIMWVTTVWLLTLPVALMDGR